MVIAYCKPQKFIDFLKDKGYEVVSNEYWDEYEIIILEKDNETFPLKFKKVFYYFNVNKICETLGIDIPDISHELYDVGTWVEEEE